MSDERKQKRDLITLDLPSRERALHVAQRLADKFGCSVSVFTARGKKDLLSPQVPPSADDDRGRWRVGQIVSRKESAGLGAIVATDGRTIKVEWDTGRTSYYRSGVAGDVRLASPQ
jgi:hypothetical protein